MANFSPPFLNEVRNKDPHLAVLLESIIDGLSNLGQHAGVPVTGKAAPPPPIEAVNVAAGSDHVHVTLTHNAPINKQTTYFLEYSANDPAFTNPHVEHLGASRERILALPAKDGNGVQIQYFFKAYPQLPGSDPQAKHAYFGTKFAPTPVTLTGASQLALLPAVGSGTGRPDGSQSGAGLGIDLQRQPLGPKRPAAPKQA